MDNHVKIFTDGSIAGNSVGAWAFLIVNGDTQENSAAAPRKKSAISKWN